MAEKITVIGYSFPAYDGMVIDLFRQSLKDDVILEVVDYSVSEKDKNILIKQLKTKYRDLFPHLKNEPQIGLGGFREYLLNGAKTNQ